MNHFLGLGESAGNVSGIQTLGGYRWTMWTVTSDSNHMDLNKTAEFYLTSYTDLAGNTETSPPRP